MSQQHPITPPPELVLQWLEDGPEDGELGISRHIANQAAQWGADMELDAMLAELKALHLPDGYAAKIRAARRPKPPSLKEHALHELNDVYNRDKIDDSTYDTICRALEALDD
jgi:hypothetical protein